MKRRYILLVLTILMLALLASPAFAGKNVEQFRPPEDVPTLTLGGWGFTYHEDTGDPTLDVVWWQAYDAGDPDSYLPIPMGVDVLMTFGWEAATYGMAKNVAHQLAITIDVTGPGGYSEHHSPAEVGSCWTGPYQYDDWWTAFLGSGPSPFFNPKIGAGDYLNRPVVPLGPFPTVGLYHFSLSIYQVLPITDLLYWGGEPRPSHYPPGDWGTFGFDFYVE